MNLSMGSGQGSRTACAGQHTWLLQTSPSLLGSIAMRQQQQQQQQERQVNLLMSQ
jgi:hypothetical protein